MNPEQLDRVIEQLNAAAPSGRKFHYHPGEYALLLLAWSMRGPQRIAELRRGPFGRLLQKPTFQPVLARAAKGWLDPAELAAHAEVGAQYVVTLGRWGDLDEEPCESQCTRRGENLVVQVNFPDEHDWEYRRLVDPKDERPFENCSHPVSDHRYTMAWARVDLDLSTGEALIEEVQNDWIRDVMEERAAALKIADCSKAEHQTKAEAERLRRYADEVLAPHAQIWAELTLCATIWVLHELLGIGRIWYHSYRGGMLFKGSDCMPPKSLYTKLPQRFCFTPRASTPSFLRPEDTPALKDYLSVAAGSQRPKFYYLELP